METDDDDFVIPSTENIQRKKCAKIDDGLAIKYNKLVFNMDKILEFSCFRRYCVFFDIFSKRHHISHNYRIDMLDKLNRYDFTPYSYDQCRCSSAQRSGMGCIQSTGFVVCFKNFFMERKRYSNHKTDKSSYMKSLYDKHSLLYEENHFYDNRINQCFMQKIRQFEELNSLLTLKKNVMKTLYKNIYNNVPETETCSRCKNICSTHFKTWRIVRFYNCLNRNYMCDYTLRIDNDTFLIPKYNLKSCDQADTRIVVYKTTKSNIVFLHKDVFYVINSSNTIIIFDIETFRSVKFFCNFNFYFVLQSSTYSNNNYSIGRGGR